MYLIGTLKARERGNALARALLTVLALTLVLLGCWLLYHREAEQIAQRQAEREVVRVNLLSKLLQSELRPVAEDLRLLADGDGLRGYIETGQAVALKAAVRRARFVSERKPDYDQIRYIDERGQEVLRVNQGGQVVDAPLLQNEADRSYFREASQLPAGGLLLSAFDLNVEGGKVETPPKPMLRFAVPLFDTSGQRRGIYIINYLGAGLIARLQQMVPTYSHRLRLLNAQGYWLKTADPSLEWGIHAARAGAAHAGTQ